jgi:hypothetical protein
VKVISIEIDYEGNASVETEGFTGKGCAAVRDAICKALGQRKAATKRKASTAADVRARRYVGKKSCG